MVKGKDLKDAQIHQLELDVERPFTFDFNTLAELQELGYPDPYFAVAGLNSMELKAIRALVYAGLVSGLAATDDKAQLDLSVNKVGQILGQLMNQQPAVWREVFTILGKAIGDFFPEKSTEEAKSAADGAEEAEKN